MGMDLACGDRVARRRSAPARRVHAALAPSRRATRRDATLRDTGVRRVDRRVVPDDGRPVRPARLHPARARKHEGHQRAAHRTGDDAGSARRGRDDAARRAAHRPLRFTTAVHARRGDHGRVVLGLGPPDGRHQSGVDLPRPPVRWLRRRHRVDVAQRDGDELGQRQLRRPGVGTQLGHQAGGGGVRHRGARVDLRVDGTQTRPISPIRAWSATPSMPSTPCSPR